MLSYSEQIIWDNEQDRSSAAPFLECPRHIPVLLQCTSGVDRNALVQAVRSIIERHAVLRSTFDESGRTVRSTAELDDPIREVEAREGGPDIESILVDEVNAPFALSSGPPCRVLLIAAPDGRLVLSITVHHLAFDAWSRQLLLLELSSLYRRARGDRTSALPELTADYSSYVSRQRDRIQTPDFEQARAYWLRYLEGARTPRLGRSGADQRGVGAGAVRYDFRLGEDRVRALRLLSRECGVTLAMTLLAALVMTIQQLSDETDISIGVPVTDRPGAAFENVIGLFMNVLTIRCQVDRSWSGRDLVRRVRNLFSDAYQHRDLPYGYLLQELGCRAASTEWPFRVVLNYVNAPPVRIDNPVQIASVLAVDVATPAAADLSLHLLDDGGDLVCTMLCAPHRFCTDEAGAAARCFAQWCRDLSQSPDARLAHNARAATPS